MFLIYHCITAAASVPDGHTGGYGSVEAMGKMMLDLETWESRTGEGDTANRVFYFAIPPNVFLDTASSIKQVGVSATGFTRLVVEKPFGHDYDSAVQVSISLHRGPIGSAFIVTVVEYHIIFLLYEHALLYE